MSEIAQGALIGIIGTIVGAIITGIISYKISKQQINARREELKEQMAHEAQEAKINRLIEARKERLHQLRKTLSDYVECSHQDINMGVRFFKVIKNKDTIMSKQETKEFFKVAELGKQLTSQLEKLHGELSDNKLDDFIGNLLKKQLGINTARMPIIRFLNNPREADSNVIEQAMNEEESLRNIQRKELIKINKRIEELLSGETST
jgi:hypothetical protein